MSVDVVDRHPQRTRYGLIVPKAATGLHGVGQSGCPVSSTDSDGQIPLLKFYYSDGKPAKTAS